MLQIIGIMILGVIVGYFMRKQELKPLPNIIKVVIWILLALLGIAVGANEIVFNALPTIEVDAIIIATASTIGSALLAFALWRWIKQKEVKHEE